MKFVNNCEKQNDYFHISNIDFLGKKSDFHILTTPTNATKRNLKTKGKNI